MAKGDGVPAYFIYDIDIFDIPKFSAYADEARALLSEFGGSIIVDSQTIEVVEGDWSPVSIVIASFPTMQLARQFFTSPRYRMLAGQRATAAHSNGVLVDSRL